ncbi:enoyl-CoA hydratase/isomerase family protein [Rhodococcus koreensis]
MFGEPFVLERRDGLVATVTLHEPEARNPLSPQLVRELTATLRALAEDKTVRVVVLTGAGKGFCAGADLRRMRSASPLEDRDEYDEILVLNRLLWEYPKPTIAAVHGFAMGAGANLMSWCDMAVVEDNARLGYPEVKAGVPSATVIPTLMRTVGRKRMYELVLTGATIAPAEAKEIGLINRVVPTGQALVVAHELAASVAEHHPSAVRLTKEIVKVTTDMSFHQALEYAKDLRVISRLRDDFTVEIAQGGSADRV